MNVIRQSDFYGFEADGGSSPLAWLPALLSLLRRHWRTIAFCLASCIGLGASYVVLATPYYTAVAQLLIDPRQGNAFQQQISATLDSMADSAIVESQVEVLRSDGTARHVVVQLRLASAGGLLPAGDGGVLGWLRDAVASVRPQPARISAAEDAVGLATERLRAMAAVRRVGLSNVIDVSVRSPDPDRAAQLANALAAVYMSDTLQAKYAVTRQAGAWLQDRLGELRDQSIAADRALQEQKAQIGLVDTDKGGMNEQALGDLTLQLGNARARTADTAARLSRIQAITAAGLAASGSVVDALANTIILKLQQQYLDDARRLVEWTLKYGPQHVAVANLRLEMTGLQASLGNELRRIQETYQSDYDVARGNEAALQKQVDGLVAVSTAANGARAQMRALESLADTYRKLYGSFLQRYTEAAQDQSFPISQARVISPATAPLHKSAPATMLVMLGAMVAGLGSGFAASVVREVTDRRFHTAAQVRQVTGLDCLAVLPRLRGSRATLLRSALEHGRSPFANAVRTVCARLEDQHGRRKPIRTIGVVSTMRSEGRSTVAANLAQMLALAGHRTALCDCDPRILPGTPSENRDALTGLTYVTAPVRAPTMQQAQASMAALNDRFDFVVLDLPPLPELSQARATAALIDSFVIVLEWSKTQQHTVIQALEDADIDSARLLGVVLNKADLAALRRFTPAMNQHYQPFSTQTGTA